MSSQPTTSQSITITKRDHKDKTDINRKEEPHSTAGLRRQVRGTQQKFTFSLLAELTIMLPQLENELGSKQLHLRVWRKHFRWCSLLNHCICLNIQVPIYSMVEANVIRMARSLTNYQILLLKMLPWAVSPTRKLNYQDSLQRYKGVLHPSGSSSKMSGKTGVSHLPLRKEQMETTHSVGRRRAACCLSSGETHHAFKTEVPGILGELGTGWAAVFPGTSTWVCKRWITAPRTGKGEAAQYT